MIENELHAPFSEHAAVLDARGRAVRLAASDLPIVVEGEPGTGRRTLASALIRMRLEQTGQRGATIEGTEGISERFRAALRQGNGSRIDVTVYNLDALPALQQRELARLLHARQLRLVAVSRAPSQGGEPASEGAPFRADELEAEVSSTCVFLPPIRDRNDDVVRWATLFLARASERLRVSAPRLTANAQRALLLHRWPGNLIELDAILNRALCLSFKPELDAVDLGFSDIDTERGSPAIKPLSEALEQFRADYIDRALAHFGGNRTQTAKALGIDVRTVFRHLEARKRQEAG